MYYVENVVDTLAELLTLLNYRVKVEKRKVLVEDP